MTAVLTLEQPLTELSYLTLEQPLTEVVTTAIIQRYSDSPVLCLSLGQYYGSANFSVLSLSQPYRAEINSYAILSQPYSDANVAAVLLSQPYSDANVAAVLLSQPYLSSDYTTISLQQPYGLLSSDAAIIVKQVYSLQASDTSFLALRQEYNLLPDTIDSKQLDFSLLIAGSIYHPTGVDLFLSEESVSYEITVSLASKHDYDTIAIFDNVVFSWDGVQYKGFVTNKDNGKSVDEKQYQESYTIQVESYSSMLVEPQAAKISVEYTHTMLAQDIVADIINQTYPMPVQWDAPPFIVVGGTFSLEDEEPMAAILRLIGDETCGCVLHPQPDGSILIRKRIPVAPGIWEISQEDIVIDDDGGVFEDSAVDDERQYLNRITVGHFAEDGKTLTEESVSSTEKLVKCYCIPWDDSVTLQTSGGSDVTIIYNGVIASETYIEVVEFVDGVGSSKHPVEAISSTVWLEDDLGIVSFSGRELSSSVRENSLVELEYEIRYHSWRVLNPSEDKIQIFIKAE